MDDVTIGQYDDWAMCPEKRENAVQSYTIFFLLRLFLSCPSRILREKS